MLKTDSTDISKGRSAVSKIVERTPELRILFVEDHSESRRVIADLLRRSGYNVSAADCAGTALDLLKAERFDVILSDIGLPDGSGCALIMLAKQRQPSIVAVALTGFSADEDIRFSREAGFDYYLTKPVDFHELRTVLNRSRARCASEIPSSSAGNPKSQAPKSN